MRKPYYKCVKGIDCFGFPDYHIVIDEGVNKKLEHYIEENLEEKFQKTKIHILSISGSVYSREDEEFIRMISLVNNSILLTRKTDSYRQYPYKKVLIHNYTPWENIIEDLGVLLNGETLPNECHNIPSLHELKKGRRYHALLDACVEYNYVNYLKRMGFSVFSIKKDDDLTGASDEEVSLLAKESNAVLVTGDRDFYHCYLGLKIFCKEGMSENKLAKRLRSILIMAATQQKFLSRM